MRCCIYFAAVASSAAMKEFVARNLWQSGAAIAPKLAKHLYRHVLVCNTEKVHAMNSWGLKLALGARGSGSRRERP